MPSTPTAIPPLHEFEEQDWQKLKHSSDEEEEEDDEDQTFECVACGKEFASEASWSNHERSKKHKQAVFRLRQELELDEEALEESMASLEMETPADSDADASRSDTPVLDESPPQSDPVSDPAPSTDACPPPQAAPPSPQRSANAKIPLDDDSRPASAGSTSTQVSKRDKRRAKEAKKKAEPPPEVKPAKPLNGKPLNKAVNGKQKDFTPAKRKGKPTPVVEITEDAIDNAVASIREKQGKLVEKWAEQWLGRSIPFQAD